MIGTEQIAQIVTEELLKLKVEQHWGEVVFKVPLKNGDPQQLHVICERTFRELTCQPMTGQPMVQLPHNKH